MIIRAINGSITAAGAAEVCLREVCQQIGWPVGRLFVTDEHSATKFVPNPIWYFSDAHRFEGFRQATEMFDRGLTNKFVLEHRLQQGKNAGLTRSVGFSVLEGNRLRAVLEFSSETATQLDGTLVSAICDIGVQLGRVFEREGAARRGKSKECSGRMRSTTAPPKSCVHARCGMGRRCKPAWNACATKADRSKSVSAADGQLPETHAAMPQRDAAHRHGTD
jgi:hypothetical protein